MCSLQNQRSAPLTVITCTGSSLTPTHAKSSTPAGLVTLHVMSADQVSPTTEGAGLAHGWTKFQSATNKEVNTVIIKNINAHRLFLSTNEEYSQPKSGQLRYTLCVVYHIHRIRTLWRFDSGPIEPNYSFTKVPILYTQTQNKTNFCPLGSSPRRGRIVI